MRKFYLFVPMFAALAVGCGDDNSELPPPGDGPTLTVEVVDVQRTQVSFELTTDKGIDYAYAVLPANAPAPASAEALFADVTAHTGMFETPTVAIDYLGIAANNDYTLYAAARTINPFVYSELRSESFDTRFEYTDAITLDAITRNSFAYHIKPEADGQYRHICVRKSDYDWFVSFMGVTPAMYVATFGLRAEGEQTFNFEDAYQDEGGYPVYIYSGTEYIILYGMADPSSMYKVLSAQTMTFSTVKAEEAPHGIDISTANITSMGADVRIEPAEGIERFRVLVLSTADKDGILIEGESALRGSIIGDPTDRSREYTAATTVQTSGLTPNTEYTVGVVGFDAQNREKVVFATFTTTPPTGPAPTIVPEPQQVAEPWHEVALNLKVEHAVSVWVCLNTKAEYDKVLQQPGFSGTMGDIIKNNGILLTPEQLAQAKAGGVLCQSDALTPNTEYIYGFYAVNEEQVTTTETYEFRTGAAPAVDLRMQLVGDYQAEIYDGFEVRNLFGVSVSEGPSEALKSDYASKNQLAILGFEPCQVDYHSPQDLLDKGWAASEQEANTNYGPKIILEVNQDGTVNTGGKNPATSELDFIMADYNGTKLYFMGYGKTANGQIMSSQQCFPVEVSEDRNTITIKGQTGVVFGSETIMYYPGVYQGDNPWYGGTDLFQGMSDLVLTRIQAEPSASGCVRSGVAAQLVVPHCVRLDLSERAGEQRPRMQMMHLFSSYR